MLYLHGQGGRLLVVVVEDVGHEGGVVGQSLAHAQRDGLAGEQAVAAGRRVHGDGHARRQHGHGQHPQDVHGRLRRQREEETSGLGRGRSASKRGPARGRWVLFSSAQPGTDATEGSCIHHSGTGTHTSSISTETLQRREQQWSSSLSSLLSTRTKMMVAFGEKKYMCLNMNSAANPRRLEFMLHFCFIN